MGRRKDTFYECILPMFIQVEGRSSPDNFGLSVLAGVGFFSFGFFFFGMG
ncbi:hypothetical protein MUO14_00620 [Halobacillus shinanisalinarum]|uniref:Uncharacterized protein n=1 Tax=Halobacillus shinanisalinarum TaxID=2932258 RepID=A0ABY4H0W3_9BACI|nr:hypothetical protein [Halobacillus shinanisalinarum]UOQ93545.1 hypothetical protein MUO14_00620 [Halobacillus shinanisalinarum]